MGQSRIKEWDLNRGKGKRKDPWGTKSATFLCPLETVWERTALSRKPVGGPCGSVLTFVVQTSFCAVFSVLKNSPTGQGHSPPWEVASLPTGPCLPESWPTRQGSQLGPVPWQVTSPPASC